MHRSERPLDNFDRTPRRGRRRRESTMCLRAAQCVVVGALLLAQNSWACNSPLVLDLQGDDYIITSSAKWEPVLFDMTGDGIRESTGWLASGDLAGFLWIDLNRNGRVDGGQELFGDAMILPSGEKAANGFEALAVYDTFELGGNGDGLISRLDLIWPFLRVWRDENADGISQKKEITSLEKWRIEAFSLQYGVSGRVDGNMNVHQFVGRYFKRSDGRGGRFEVRPMLLEDIYFRVESLGASGQ
jgi:hypothetical protein